MSTSALGCKGTLTVATRGPDGPGEVQLQTGFGTESYVAYSEEPIPSGAVVYVYDERGGRIVDVVEFPGGKLAG